MDCQCEVCVRRAWAKAVDDEFGLIWRSQDEGQDSYAVHVLASQLDDVAMLRELIVLFAMSARMWHGQYEDARVLLEELEAEA